MGVGAVAGIPATRKTLVFISEEWNYRALESPAFTAVMRAAAANVAIYPVNPAGLEGFGDVVSQMSAAPGRGPSVRLWTSAPLAFDALAAETGGRAAVGRNNVDAALARIVDEAGHYYLLGFTPAGGDARGKSFHPLQVRVRRPGVSVQARKGYALSHDEGALPSRSVPLVEVARLPVPARGLPLRVHAASFRDAGKKDRVVVTVDARLGAASRARTVEYAVIALDDHARAVGSDDGSARVPPSDAAIGARIVSTLNLEPGLATIKVAVRTDDGLVGSVFLEVDVPRFAGPDLALSDLEIGAVPAHVIVASALPAFLNGGLPAPPTASRAFQTSDALALYLEAYRVRAADGVTATASVSGAGPVVRQTALAPVPAPPERMGGNRRAFAGQVSLRDLPEGDYTLQVEVRDGARTATRISRIQIRNNATR